MKDRPCKNCPDQPIASQKPQVPFDITKLGLPQVVYVAYNGLSDLQHTLPIYDGVQRQFQRPVFSPDGSLEYPRLSGDETPPDEIDGYERDPDNAWKFHPIWPECALRLQGTELKPNGCIDVVMVCNNPETSTFGKKVTCETCTGCPVKRPRLVREAGL